MYVGLLVYLIPIACVVCIGLLLSTITRNSAAAVVGTLMVSLLFQLIGILPGLTGLQPYLLSTQFNAWQGLLRTPIDWAPIIRAAWVCAMYGVPAIVRGVPGVPAAGCRRRLTPRSPARLSGGCWWWTTIRRCGGCSSGHCGARASRSPWPRMGERHWPRPSVTRPTSSCSTWRCRGVDGLAVCRRLRARGLRTPILMLTARDAVPDRVAGLEAGADDYLVKPFAVGRAGGTAARADPPRVHGAGCSSYADLVLDVGDPDGVARRADDRADRA